MAILIKKNNNTFEEFDPEKIVKSCINAGVSTLSASSIAIDISNKVYDGIKSNELRNLVYENLKKVDKEAAERYYQNNLLVRTSQSMFEPFDCNKIINSLIKETGINQKTAEKIAKKVRKELNKLRLEFVTAPLIREFVCAELLRAGMEEARAKYTRLGMPVYDVTELIQHGLKENANLQYNPETIHKLMADQISREYALINILPLHLADAHMNGEIHIHDLDYFATRPFCFSHDIRFFLKNGFKADGTGNHTSIAGPAKKAEVAFLHAAKVLAASQTNCSGGQGFSYFNVFLAPYIRGLEYKRVKQLAQMFIYEMSQMYVARGGQVVFSSIDCDMSVPEQFLDVPAVQPGGIVQDSITYSDYEPEVKTLFRAITDVYLEGDYIHKPFNFPKFEVQIRPERMDEDSELLLKVSELASKFGTPYYIINQPYMPKYACYQCCAFLMPLDDANTEEDVVNGTIRGGGLQDVTINLPQIAYESNGNESKFFELLNERIDKAKEVLLLKNKIIHKNLSIGMLPFMAQKVNEKGDKYLEPDKQSYIVGLVGMNECCKSFTGKELHEDEGWRFGLKVMKKMKDKVAELRKETNLNFTLARTPAESCAYRLAQIDLRRYGNKAIVNGEGESAYYTNSFHVNPSADIPLWKRLSVEGSFHPLTDGGAMTHIWLGEKNPEPEAIMELTKKIANKTAIQYFAFTKDLSVCKICNFVSGGLVDSCPNCGATEIKWHKSNLKKINFAYSNSIVAGGLSVKS